MRQRDIERVLKYCNAFREATGQELLDDLPPGRPRHPESCPIALGVDKGCEIGVGELRTSEKELADTASVIFKTAPCKEYRLGASSWWTVPLPSVMSSFIEELDSHKDTNLSKYRIV